MDSFITSSWDTLSLQAGTALGLSVLAGYTSGIGGLHEALALAACAAWAVFTHQIKEESPWPSWSLPQPEP